MLLNRGVQFLLNLVGFLILNKDVANLVNFDVIILLNIAHFHFFLLSLHSTTLNFLVMKIADPYVRVSTDEQADKGYSQRDQEERLRKYCEINNIRVRKVILEDHSAKTFKRPAWTGLLGDLRKHKGHTDLILFTKWDRFSRNAGDAYQMISTLRRLGIEPQAVEQPLDLSIPENKMMLAFYLAAPEVENDRRAFKCVSWDAQG